MISEGGPRRRRAAGFALVAAVLFVTLLPGNASAATFNVSIIDFAYQPSTLTIAPGDTVVWTNNDFEGHTVTADDGSFDSGILQPEADFTRTFPTPGSIPYFCEIHFGQVGTIVVEGTAPTTTTIAPTTTTMAPTTTTMAPATTTTQPPATTTTSPPPPQGPMQIAADARSNGNVLRIVGMITCEVGNRFRIEMIVSQGDTQGQGVQTGQCRGTLQRFITIVSVTSGPFFTSGPGQVDATAQIGNPGSRTIEDTFGTTEQLDIDVRGGLLWAN